MCGPCDAVGAGHDAVGGAGGCDGDEFLLSCWSAPGDRIPAVIRGGSCGPCDSVEAGHDAVVGAMVCNGDEFFLSCWSAPGDRKPVVVDGGGLCGPCDAIRSNGHRRFCQHGGKQCAAGDDAEKPKTSRLDSVSRGVHSFNLHFLEQSMATAENDMFCDLRIHS